MVIMKDKEQLDKLIKARNTQQKVVMRAKIVLLYLKGINKSAISKTLSIGRPTVYLWIRRYEKDEIQGILQDASRPGRKKQIDEEKEKQIVDATLKTKPKGATHWSTRTMAKQHGVSKMAVQRIWKKYNLKPHLVKKFKLSNDPKFVEKVIDVVGLYLNPPEKAIVFCVDEKSQIQALDRTQPSLPLKKGRANTMTHDYKRNGTTSLFAALNMLDGKVIGNCYQKHTHKEFLRFLIKIDKQTITNFDLHLIMDNYGTHKTNEVKNWLKKHPRFHFHFIPTSSSWLNMVERLFSEITNKMIRRGVFKSVEQLKNDITKFLDLHNENPKIYTWTKDADTIISKVIKCKEALGTQH